MSRRDEMRRLLDDREDREAHVGDDPSKIFGLLAADSVPEDRLDALQLAVEAEIAPPVRRWASWQAAAALVVLILAGWWATKQLDDPAVESPATVAQIEAVEILPAEGPVRGVELLASPGEARLLDASVGDTQIVIIFDEALDL